jgi:hypothetical protein
MKREHEVIVLRLIFALYIGLILGAFGLHYWTVKIAYHVQGRGGALGAFMFPVGAEIYWAIKGWRATGFSDLYTLAVVWYGICCLLLTWLLAIIEKP